MTPPDDGKGATVLRWALDAVAMYRDCSAKHEALVRAWPQAVVD